MRRGLPLRGTPARGPLAAGSEARCVRRRRSAPRPARQGGGRSAPRHGAAGWRAACASGGRFYGMLRAAAAFGSAVGWRAADAVWWRPGSTEGWEVLFFFVFVLTASVGFEPRPMVVGARGAGEGGARCVALKPDDPKRRSIRRLDRSRRCQWRCLPGYKFVGTQCSDCLCVVQISGWT